jgi:hypothetical protein
MHAMCIQRQFAASAESIEGTSTLASWLALYAIVTDKALSGQSMLVVPVSFSGKVMAEIAQMNGQEEGPVKAKK